MRKLATILAMVLVAVGCNKGANEQEITETREVTAPKAMEAAPAASSAERFGLQGMPGASPHGAKPGGGFKYSVPEGWKEQPPTQFRLANFTAGPNGEVEVYVSKAGGGVGNNVNRWRKQIGLEDLNEQDIAQLPKKKVLGEDAAFVNWEGTYGGMQGAEAKAGYRLAGMILDKNGEGVFVKMVGPAAAVEQELGRLEAFASSLEEGASDPHAGMAMGGDPHAGLTPEQMAAMQMDPNMGTLNGQVTWSAPEGWEKAQERPMRAVTFKTADGAEAYVSVLSGMAGGAVANVNRWRAQMGNEQPMSAEEVAALPKIDALGKQCPTVELTGSFKGMGGEAQAGSMLLGMVCELGEQTVFAKMTGPEAAVKANKDKFVAFCQSLKMAEAPAGEAAAPQAASAPAAEAPSAAPQDAPASEPVSTQPQQQQ